MMPFITKRRKLAGLIVVTLALGCAIVSNAQPSRMKRGATRGQDQNKSQNLPFTFGDITLLNYDSLAVNLGKSAEVVGPNSVIESNDKKTSVFTRIQAPKMDAFLVAKDTGKPDKVSSTVDRIEASGGVKFYSTRPLEGGATQTVHGTGSKAIFIKQKNKITLLGPITFEAEQPGADGKTPNIVKGTADQASFDGDNEILIFSGNVNTTITAPDVLNEPATVNGADLVKIDMSARPYNFRIERGKLDLWPKQKPPVEQDKTKKK